MLTDLTGARGGTPYMQNIVSISDGGYIAGLNGVDARVLRSGNQLTLNREIAPGTLYPSARVAGLSPSGDYVAGWVDVDAINGQSYGAVWGWDGFEYARSFLYVPRPPYYEIPTAKALAVSSSGRVVGWYLKSMNGTTVKRGFRTQAGAATQYIIQPNDVLNPEIDNAVNLSSAYTLNAAGTSVGATVTAAGRFRATYWKSNNSNPFFIGDLLDPNYPVDPNPEAPYLRNAEILSLNTAGQMVGRSWSTNSQMARALIANSAGTLNARDLYDRYFVRLAAGTVLEDAVAINETGQILCNGRVDGSPRAFLLIPRSPGN